MLSATSNVLIGSNGAGKSSFLQVFSLLQRMATGRLQVHVGQCGGPDALLWYGARKTRQLAMDITFADGRIYSCTLEPTQDNRFLYTEERVQDSKENTVFRETGHFESRLAAHSERHKSLQVFAAMKNWHPVHLNDAGACARQRQAINDTHFLRPDGSNLAPILHLLQSAHTQHYNRLVRTIRLAVPFFRDFVLRPCQDNKGQSELLWTEQGCDVPLKAHLLSDATLRFMCLATLLLLPGKMQPATILVDGAELGLHPYALKLLAGILRSTSHSRQIIVSPNPRPWWTNLPRKTSSWLTAAWKECFCIAWTSLPSQNGSKSTPWASCGRRIFLEEDPEHGSRAGLLQGADRREPCVMCLLAVLHRLPAGFPDKPDCGQSDCGPVRRDGYRVQP